MQNEFLREKKIVAYAAGQVFEANWNQVEQGKMIAVADKKAMEEKELHGIPFIHPSKLSDLEYDYIAIFSNKLFEKIKNELIGEYFIPEEKIISWKVLLQPTEFAVKKKIEFLKEFIQQKQVKRVLDISVDVLPKYFLNKSELGLEENVLIDGVGEEKYLGYRRIYNRIYSDIAACSENKYDLLVAWEYTESLNEIISIVDCRYVLWYTMLDKEIVNQGKLYRFTTADGTICLLDRYYKLDTQNDAQIYVVTHKQYNLLQDCLYTPLVVGDKYNNHSYLSEHNGDNIAYLNGKINECTALYWIWKNTNSAYVGLNHYRRKFYNDWNKNSGNYLDIFHLQKILEKYDIIMPKVWHTKGETALEQLYRTTQREAVEKGLKVVRDAIAKNQPEYLGAFEAVMQGHAIYICNMFVTRREILNEYCEWLFSFLIEAAEEMDVSTYDDYSKRVIGFFAERMWTVWLMKKDLKIKELPITEV